MPFNRATVGVMMLLLAAAMQSAGAAVSAEEAVRLKSELTPFGAERAGNKEGTIPAWDGGYTKVSPGYQPGQPRPDPFAGEKPRLTVTAENMHQYDSQLSVGMKALLKRFPTYRLDVYPTHRTAAAPQWVYDNTFKNATRAKVAPSGLAVEGAYGGIPFPIPQNGAETIWNHLYSWKGEAFVYNFSTYTVAAGRQPVLSTKAAVEFQYPYYYQNSTPEQLGATYWYLKTSITGPPLRVGEKYLTASLVKQGRQGDQAWSYLVGQRRVRRTLNFEYDTPTFVTSGIAFYDEVVLFSGALDRYDWKLVGKKEMFVPYNISQDPRTKNVNDMMQPNHLNPDKLRWELHRVWVVEATLAPGKRHVMPKRRLYLDEDTWQAMLSEGWDAKGQLWHVGQTLPILVPEVPVVFVQQHAIYDFLQGAYAVLGQFDDQQPYQVAMRQPEAYFYPAALVAEGIR